MKLPNVAIAIAYICVGTVAFVKGSCNPFKQSDVPLVVKQAFEKEFPGNKASWEEEKGSFEAEFRLNGIETSATYNQYGMRIELEIEIKITEMPANAIDYMNVKYPNTKIKEAAKITDDKNTLTYEAEIKKDGKSWDVIFDSQGNFIKQVEGD